MGVVDRAGLWGCPLFIRLGLVVFLVVFLLVLLFGLLLAFAAITRLNVGFTDKDHAFFDFELGGGDIAAHFSRASQFNQFFGLNVPGDFAFDDDAADLNFSSDLACIADDQIAVGRDIAFEFAFDAKPVFEC